MTNLACSDSVERETVASTPDNQLSRSKKKDVLVFLFLGTHRSVDNPRLHPQNQRPVSVSWRSVRRTVRQKCVRNAGATRAILHVPHVLCRSLPMCAALSPGMETNP